MRSRSVAQELYGAYAFRHEEANSSLIWPKINLGCGPGSCDWLWQARVVPLRFREPALGDVAGQLGKVAIYTARSLANLAVGELLLAGGAARELCERRAAF